MQIAAILLSIFIANDSFLQEAPNDIYERELKESEKKIESIENYIQIAGMDDFIGYIEMNTLKTLVQNYDIHRDYINLKLQDYNLFLPARELAPSSSQSLRLRVFVIIYPMAQRLKVLLAGGGTGGHIYPIIAVSQKLKVWAEKNAIAYDLRYFGAPESYKSVLQASGIKISKIVSSKMRRYFSLLNFFDFFKFIFSFFQSLFKIYWYMPDVAFSKGGPGALPVVLACKFYFIPIVVHESDAIPGLTNKISVRLAQTVDLAFNSAAQYIKTKKELNIVGNPVREEILAQISQEQAKIELGLDPQKPLVLVLGGSQGSGRINDFILENLEGLLLKYQVMHQVGTEKYKDYKAQYDFLTENFSPAMTANYKFTQYLENSELSKAMDAADVIISRSGAGAIFEIAAKGKPSILIPFPDAASNHQKENAYQYAQSGAAVVIEEENLLPSILLSELEKILNKPEVKLKMGAAARDYFQPDAANKIATDILELWQD